MKKYFSATYKLMMPVVLFTSGFLLIRFPESATILGYVLSTLGLIIGILFAFGNDG